jgi:hypothetical protein
VCLNELKDDDRVRMLRTYVHILHLIYVGVCLEGNTNDAL